MILAAFASPGAKAAVVVLSFGMLLTGLWMCLMVGASVNGGVPRDVPTPHGDVDAESAQTRSDHPAPGEATQGIIGRVVGCDAGPAAGVEVTLRRAPDLDILERLVESGQPERNPPLARTRTGKSGHFMLSVKTFDPDHVYRMSVVTPSTVAHSGVFALQVGQWVNASEMVLRRPRESPAPGQRAVRAAPTEPAFPVLAETTHGITGHVVDCDGRPVAGVEVMLLRAPDLEMFERLVESGKSIRNSPLARTCTGKSGHFTLLVKAFDPDHVYQMKVFMPSAVAQSGVFALEAGQWVNAGEMVLRRPERRGSGYR
ncbi:MAG: hypothetical protein AAF628_32745 [Planctomycetota bacterium]